jgi:hypothetical protein
MKTAKIYLFTITPMGILVVFWEALSRLVSLSVGMEKMEEVGKSDRYLKQEKLSQRTGISGICIRQSGGARL